MKAPIGTLCITCAVTFMANSSKAAESCTYLPEDIPQPLALELSLAGDPQPDVGRFLSAQRAHSGKLSPNGSNLAFMSNASGAPQIWVTDTANPWPLQLTFGEPVSFFEWAPDGRLVYGVDRGGNEREGFYLITPDGLHEEELLAPSDNFRAFGGFTPDMSRLAYATTGRIPDTYDIHMLDVDDLEDRLVFEGRMGFYVDSISPDGRYVLLNESAGEDANILFLLEVESGELSQIFPGNPDRSRMDNINWAADSSGFYFVTNLGREFSGIAFYQLAQAEMNWVYRADREVDELVYSSSQNLLGWTEIAGGFEEVFLMAPGDSKPVAVKGLPAGVYGLHMAENSGEIAVSASGPSLPGDVWVANSDGNSRRITQSAYAGLNLDQMVQPRHVSIEARDGITIYGLLYEPVVESSSAIPFLISVHGGPTAHATPDFDPTHQYLLSKGIGVLDLNYRGSDGYGKSFARLNDKRLRENELYDLEDAANWLRRDSGLNVAKVAIAGGSYGGYLTMAALARLPGVFDAGVAMVGVSDWITALEDASPALRATDRIEYGDIGDPDDREFFRSISPVNYADQVVAPLMLQHGANDPRDPPAESDHFACAVRANGATVEYLRFPDEGHGLRKRVNRITFYTRMAEFLKRHLGAE